MAIRFEITPSPTLLDLARAKTLEALRIRRVLMLLVLLSSLVEFCTRALIPLALCVLKHMENISAYF